MNAAEAERVRRIFPLYLECGSVSRTIPRLDEMGWTTRGGSGYSPQARDRESVRIAPVPQVAQLDGLDRLRWM